MSIRFCIVMLFIPVSFAVNTTLPVAANQCEKVIKLSSAGICHALTSRYYNKVNKYKNSYCTLDQCFDAGGRPPKSDLSANESYLAYTIGKAVPKVSNRNGTLALSALAIEAAAENVAESKKTGKDLKEFAGSRLGVAIAFTGVSESLIDDVSIDENGTVHVNDSYKQSGALMLEGHQFIFEKGCDDMCVQWGTGPFFALSVADKNGVDPFSAYGVGWMVGWQKPDSSDSWNVGLGYYINTEAKLLREGVVDGGMTTETDPGSLLKTTTQDGWMLIFSSTW